jgi:hypothetical protein
VSTTQWYSKRTTAKQNKDNRMQPFVINRSKTRCFWLRHNDSCGHYRFWKEIASTAAGLSNQKQILEMVRVLLVAGLFEALEDLVQCDENRNMYVCVRFGDAWMDELYGCGLDHLCASYVDACASICCLGDFGLPILG